ncbi:MAG: HAD-IC family P-type ATPase [Patescibacteria group bacterium]
MEIVAILVIPIIFGQWMKTFILNFAVRYGANRNIIIKNVDVLKKASKINAIVIDKNRALMDGKLTVTDIISYNDFNLDDVLRYEANVEFGSNHPLARAILDEAKKREAVPSKPVEKFESFAGLGIKAQVNGKTILAGKEKLLKDNEVDVSKGGGVVEKLIGEGKTLKLLAVDGVFAGMIATADTVRHSAKNAISELKSMGVEVIMITGDNLKAAEVVARDLGIDKYYAEFLPQNKIDYIRMLQNENRFTAMVSDSVNDAPALANSNVGIVVGSGADIASGASNIFLTNYDPEDIVVVIKLSKDTAKKIKQNLFIVVIYNVLAIMIMAVVFYNSFGWRLRLGVSVFLISASFIALAVNAGALKITEPKLKMKTPA